jgi:acetyl-CoA decarbonylase/synthase, CODH/ACS complex subunit delta
MTKKVKLSEMKDIFKDVQILSLEGVTIEGDIEIDIGKRGGGFNPMRSALL